MNKEAHKDSQAVAQQERMVLKQMPRDFLDPAREWCRIFAETRDTFLLVLVAAGGWIVAAKSGGTITLACK